jgi:hypothetical protein
MAHRPTRPTALSMVVLAVVVAASCGPADGSPPGPSSPEVPERMLVQLDVAAGHDVSVAIDDSTRRVVQAVSGQAGDGMTVRWFNTHLRNLAEDTIEVTWVGLPRDEQVELSIREEGGELVLAFRQGAPPVLSTVGHDRVLVLYFDAPLSAGELRITYTRGTP